MQQLLTDYICSKLVVLNGGYQIKIFYSSSVIFSKLFYIMREHHRTLNTENKRMHCALRYIQALILALLWDWDPAGQHRSCGTGGFTFAEDGSGRSKYIAWGT